MKPMVLKEKKIIEGVKTKNLKVLPDERGRLMEVLRSDEEMFSKFGQLYVTTAYPGVVKAWHYHKTQVDHFVVVHGMMKIVLYDDRAGSPTKGVVNEFFMGDHKQILLRVPARVLHGFKCISECEAIVINIPTEVYHYAKPDEYRMPAHTKKIPYDWSRQDG